MAAISNQGSCCFINDEIENEHEGCVSYTNKLNRSSLMSLRLSRSISSSGYASSPTRRLYDIRFDHRQPHFLECCYLCRKSIAADADIFMYRGDTPFCSEECRMEQIEMDEAKEKQKSVSMKSGLQTSSNPSNAEGFSCMVLA